ncbi:MAG: hypothetical protein CMQ33_05075, partial [Gammaproteobacteria bacterium]|nr:hypothetical protein [Gammaproteobacteria bacterium]
MHEQRPIRRVKNLTQGRFFLIFGPPSQPLLVYDGSGDFDGDGIADLLWRNTNGANIVWLMDGETIKERGQLPTVGGGWTISGVGDFDMDGMADVFWNNPDTGANSIWLLNGTERKARGTIPSVDKSWSPFGVYDMNADSMADIL